MRDHVISALRLAVMTSSWQYPGVPKWMRGPHLAFLLLLVAFGFQQASAQNPEPIERAVTVVDSLIEQAIQLEEIPGAVILLAHRGQILHHRAYGYAHLYDYSGERLEHPVTMTVDHLFDLASMTKVMATTFGIMLLVDQGRVNLDWPVHEYLPHFTDARKDSVTIRHLLTHTAGLDPWQPLYLHGQDREAAYEIIRSQTLRYAVGRERWYSDLGFILLGYIIEEVSGQPLDTFLDEHLYGPIGLRKTTFNPLQKGHRAIAATSHGNPYEYRMIEDDSFGYLIRDEASRFRDWRRYSLMGEVNDGNSFYAHGGVAGHAGLFSTAADLKILFDLILNDGLHRGRRILRSETIRQVLTPDEFGNGLGWWMNPQTIGLPELPPGTIAHSGFTGTFGMAIPDMDLILILLTNRQNVGMSDTGYFNLSPLRRAVAGVILEAVQPKSTR